MSGWQPSQYDPRQQPQPYGGHWPPPQQQPQYPPPPPPQQYQPPQYPPPRRQPPRRKSRTGLIVGIIIAFAVATFILVTALAGGGTASPPPSAPTTSATIAASAPQGAGKPKFPPMTLADFRAFAATGDASQVHQVASSTEGLPSCPEPNFYVTVSSGLTPKEVEADLSAFFVQQGLLGNRCGAFVFAFHSEADYQAHQNDGYTVGRVDLDTNGGASQGNLEVDAGDVTSVQAEFHFNF